ncbi:hypothetical protein [Streptomyces fructofermentans]|uniref:Uncharacterized protein n=1 Tax=Streptomyces fructofermentans TaxID=152141 RepID=A0A918U6D5_9ACTN|nr:hypothetical protein [Streptomyces fructofermentans]GGX99130.1 hypothetical protein GCM10010515_76630 [Streptomyces fructofermentans]
MPEPLALTPQITDEQRDAMLRRLISVATEFRRIAEVVAPAVAAAAAELHRTFEALKETGLVDSQGRPVPRAARPAWQSPHGPAHRRRT